MFNSLGPRLNRKIVVFESDDWGSTRLRSASTFTKLVKKGLQLSVLHYDMYDTLESAEDLELLFNLCASYVDSQSSSLKFTFNTVLGNPDYHQIRQSDYQQYHFEGFQQTYLRYWGKDLTRLWETATTEKLIKPQFHCREHLNVALWLEGLQKNIGTVRTGFDHEYFAMPCETPSKIQQHYLASFAAESTEDLKEKEFILADGLRLFQQIFGVKSASFIACNYTWPSAIERILQEEGIQIVQGQRAQLDTMQRRNKIQIVRHYSGERGRGDMIYLVRNCYFEPSSDPGRDWIDTCLQEISNAFFWGKPAIISTHRVNYVSSINKSLRDNNLKLLNKLVKSILSKWPHVEFMSTDQLQKVYKRLH